MKRVARRIGILVIVGCFAWSLANFHAWSRDTGWYHVAVILFYVFSPAIVPLLARPEIDEYRARKKANKP